MYVGYKYLMRGLFFDAELNSYIFSGEFRPPNENEYYLSSFREEVLKAGHNFHYPRIIVVKSPSCL